MIKGGLTCYFSVFSLTVLLLFSVAKAQGSIITTVSGSGPNDVAAPSAIYCFVGFRPPVENPPLNNTAQAGSNIPIKWRLLDASGGFISDQNTVTSIQFQQVSCLDYGSTMANSMEVTETSGNSGLRYDTSGSQYIYNWKTDKAMAGNCYVLILTLYDSNEYRHTSS